MNKKNKISIIGLGYVGLPLAVEFGKKFETLGFDISSKRISELRKKIDTSGELSGSDIQKAKKLQFSSRANDLENSNIYIITVPTPVDQNKKPNLSHLLSATKLVAKYLNRNDIVIYESTVFPGTTEEICVPLLKKISKLQYISDEENFNYSPGFYCGYSPERINPGDKRHQIKKITKVVSGSTNKITKFIKKLYSKIITAAIYVAPNIKTAEASKIIENIQRDLNIALVNELSIIFEKMNLDTKEILKAANTKWNFAYYEPGLVGGHCIGVDPYYLTYKAKQLGYKPKIVLAGRKLNDAMGKVVGWRLLKEIKKRNKKNKIKKNNILIMGVTFKENCRDFRNTKIIDIYNFLKIRKLNVDLLDPNIDKKKFYKEYKIKIFNKINNSKKKYDAIVIAVPHKQFIKMGIDKIRSYCHKNSVIYDVKGIFEKTQTDLRL